MREMKTEAGRLRRILVATDFSKTADKGLSWAAFLARAHGAAVTILHALPPPAVIPDFLTLDLDQYEIFRKAARARLEKAVASLARKGVKARGLLSEKPAERAVEEAVRSEPADLVVVGTRGLTGFKHLFLGSTAERILRTAPGPVLSVHPRDPDGPRGAWTVLVPTDFSGDAARAASVARRIVGPRGHKGRIVLLHVSHMAYEYAMLRDATPDQFFAEVRRHAAARLEKAAVALRHGGVRVDVRVRDGFPVEAILREARAARADLIAMGTHGRRGVRRLLLGSTAERVVQHAECPVVTVRVD